MQKSRLILITNPGLRINWDKFRSAQDRVLPTYWQLKQLPEYCLNHGVATSLDYSDSDQNLVDGL